MVPSLEGQALWVLTESCIFAAAVTLPQWSIFETQVQVGQLKILNSYFYSSTLSSTEPNS